MKFLSHWFMLEICTLLFLPHLFSSHFNAEKTKELKQQLTALENIYADIDNKPDGIEELWQKVTKLITEGADPHTTTEHYAASAIHFAAVVNDVSGIEFLLKHGLNIEAITKNRRTPLFLAVLLGYLKVITKLIVRGANIEATIANSETPLMLAARFEQKEAVIELLGFGATKGKEALMEATGEAEQILSALFSNNPIVPGEHWLYHIIRRGFNEELRHFSTISPPALVNQFDSHGFTPLDIALATGNKEAFLLLLDMGADPTIGRFNPRVTEKEKPYSSTDSPSPSLYYLNYNYAYNYYLPILVPLFKAKWLPVEVIEYIVNLMLLT